MRDSKPQWIYALRGKVLRTFSHALLYGRLTVWWTTLSVLVGVLMGCIGAAFVYGIAYGTAFRENHPWIVVFLPLAGLFIVWLYHVTRNTHDRGTNMVLSSLRSESSLPFLMAPLIFISTILTHTFGGSVGREGAALQLGGSLSGQLAKSLHMRDRDTRMLIACGMSAAFSAIFRTPVAAAIFSMEVGCVGSMHYAAILPCVISSLVASATANALGISAPSYTVLEIPELSLLVGGKIFLIGTIFALISMLFCITLHRTESLFSSNIANPYQRAMLSGIIVVLLTIALHTTDYLGLGTQSIVSAIGGSARWYAFLLKILFTAITLAGGFKGGEIVPTFFIGATLGCSLGSLFSLSPSLCAAMGMVALFAAVTNCPIASVLIALELFGSECLPHCLLVIAVSYVLSGYYGLYKEQQFAFAKLSDIPISRKTKQ